MSEELKGKIPKAHPSLGIVCVPTNQSGKTLQFKRTGVGKLLPMGQLGLSSCIVLMEHSYTHSFTQCLRLLSCYNSRTEYLPQRPYGLRNPKYLIFGSLQKKRESSELYYLNSGASSAQTSGSSPFTYVL